MRKLAPFVTIIVSMMLLGACKAKKESPEFEKKWAKAKKESGLTDIQVIDTKDSQDLKGNVQRLGEPTAPPGATGSRAAPFKLSQNQVGRYIRRQLARLTSCHRATKGRSGKAMLTVTIESSGRVSSVSVDAPSFGGTRLSTCLEAGARRWRFPRFRAESSLTYTYPFIFR